MQTGTGNGPMGQRPAASWQLIDTAASVRTFGAMTTTTANGATPHQTIPTQRRSPLVKRALARLDELANGLSHLPILQNHGHLHENVGLAATLGPMGRCYDNAMALAIQRPGKVHYVEGVAVQPRTGIALPHAWIEDNTGRPFEATWRSTQGWVYLGMRFTLEDLLGLHELLGEDPRPILAEDWARSFAFLRSHECCCPVPLLR